MTEQKTLEELKALLTKDEENRKRYLEFQADCVRIFGPAAGIFLRQLVFWTGQSALEDGWLWKTKEEMEAETGLSRRQQDKARKVLVSKGVLKEDRRGVPRRMHYRVKFEALIDTLNHRSSPPGNSEQASSPGSSGQASSPGNTEPTSPPATREPTSSPDISERAIQESTSESTDRDDLADPYLRDSVLQTAATNEKNGNIEEEKETPDSTDLRDLDDIPDFGCEEEHQRPSRAFAGVT